MPRAPAATRRHARESPRAARTKAIVPSGFHQHPACMAIARAGNPSLPQHRRWMLTGHQPYIGHQLLGGAEAFEVADLGGEHHRRHQVHAPQRCRAQPAARASIARPVRRCPRLSVRLAPPPARPSGCNPPAHAARPLRGTLHAIPLPAFDRPLQFSDHRRRAATKTYLTVGGPHAPPGRHLRAPL